jgi:peptidase A4-like protein
VRWATWLVVLALVALPSPSPSNATARPIVVVAANQSFNWSGYVQGSLEKGTTFHSIAATWLVPTATQRRSGEAEYSSSWIGIGGGCLNTECTLTDATLIQAGVGHDVDAAGKVDYYAWWEVIPAPLVRTTLRVGPGDRIGVAIFEHRLPETWTIAIVNFTTRGVFTLTLPYPSTHGSAEWVIETPVVISESGAVSVGPMPNLSVVRFDFARVNGRSPGFVASERIELVDFDLTPIASPSLPDAQGDGFNDCTYATTCSAP